MLMEIEALESFAIPAPGQLVNVRQRHFVVLDVQKSSLPGNPLAADSARDWQHLLTLSSVEDDALGEEVQVVWEIEPGAHIYEKIGLPSSDDFDEADRFDALTKSMLTTRCMKSPPTACWKASACSFIAPRSRGRGRIAGTGRIRPPERHQSQQ